MRVLLLHLIINMAVAFFAKSVQCRVGWNSDPKHRFPQIWHNTVA